MYDCVLFYNVDTGEFNTVPKENGTYKFYFIGYQSEPNIMQINEYDVEYVKWTKPSESSIQRVGLYHHCYTKQYCQSDNIRCKENEHKLSCICILWTEVQLKCNETRQRCYRSTEASDINTFEKSFPVLREAWQKHGGRYVTDNLTCTCCSKQCVLVK